MANQVESSFQNSQIFTLTLQKEDDFLQLQVNIISAVLGFVLLILTLAVMVLAVITHR